MSKKLTEAILFKLTSEKIDKVLSKPTRKGPKKKIKVKECPTCKEPFEVKNLSKSRKYCSKTCAYPNQKFLSKGDTFPGNRLTVIRFMGRRNNNLSYECLCECGKKTLVEGRYLISNRIKSCGCRLKDYYKNEVGRNRTGVPYAKGATGRFNTWQRVNSLNWYMKDAVETPLLVPPEATTLKKYKDKNE